MKIIKDNIVLSLFCITALLAFVILLIYKSGISEEIDNKKAEIQRAIRLQKEYVEELSIYSNLTNDFTRAQSELKQLATIEKQQRLFWKKILNPRENHMVKWKDSSAESVNADITRLFSSLRARCRSKEIELPSTANKSPTIGFGSANRKPENNYGFGFSSYDGFWPSFTREEAKILGVQAKIIKEIVEILSQSVSDFSDLTLIEILRESAGEVDRKHIKEDLLSLGAQRKLLLRSGGGIESLAFKVSINGQSSHARTFINQLKPPFMLRNFTVKREIKMEQEVEKNLDFVPNPFGGTVEEQSVPQSQTKPIVRDTSSEFVFLIEYITEISNDLQALFENQSIWENADEVVLSEFLTSSGNSEILEEAKSKIFLSE